MRPFPHLHVEQDSLLELLAVACDQRVLADCSRIGEICRLATDISQVRIEIVYPHCVGHARAGLIDASIIDLDLARVLIFELANTQTTAFLYPSLVRALDRLLRGRFAHEESPDGLWASALEGGLDPGPADIATGARLRALAEPADWVPLQPFALETLRSSVPYGAVPYRDLQP